MGALQAFIIEVIERLFEHWERVNCSRCGGSGFYLAGPYTGQGSYDMICDECGGQSASADRSFFIGGSSLGEVEEALSAVGL